MLSAASLSGGPGSARYWGVRAAAPPRRRRRRSSSRYTRSVWTSAGSRACSSRTRGSTSRSSAPTIVTISSSSTVVRASASDVTAGERIRMALSTIQHTIDSARTAASWPARAAARRRPPATAAPVRCAARRSCRESRSAATTASSSAGSSTYTREPRDPTCASARKALALNARTSANRSWPVRAVESRSTRLDRRRQYPTRVRSRPHRPVRCRSGPAAAGPATRGSTAWPPAGT